MVGYFHPLRPSWDDPPSVFQTFPLGPWESFIKATARQTVGVSFGLCSLWLQRLGESRGGQNVNEVSWFPL